MITVVLATGNKGKLRELAAMLDGFGIELKSLADFPDIGEIVEDGDTFEANALIKAKAVCDATGLPAIADDSGLAVDALNGAPGVYSARYSGDGATDATNNIKLLKELDCTPDAERTARFVCALAAMAPNGHSLVVRGEWEGQILREPRGENGFGYDPLFFLPRLGKSSAELPPAEKNAISHRGLALAKLREQWPEFAKASGLK